jgi:hypothetical protein
MNHPHSSESLVGVAGEGKKEFTLGGLCIQRNRENLPERIFKEDASRMGTADRIDCKRLRVTAGRLEVAFGGLRVVGLGTGSSISPSGVGKG